VAGHRPVLGFGRPLADHDLGSDEPLAAAARAGPGNPQRPTRPQAGRQLAAQRAAPLDVEGLVDRLVGDPHGPIIGEVDPESVRDLLRTPRGGPAPVLTASVAPPDPAHLRARDRGAVRSGDHPGEPVLHVVAQGVVGGEFGGFRAPGPAVGVPLRGGGPVVQPAAAGGRVAAQLP
jgi:hypothetical protein